MSRRPGRPRKADSNTGNPDGKPAGETAGVGNGEHQPAKTPDNLDAIGLKPPAPVDVSDAGFTAPVSGPIDPGPGSTTETLSGDEPRRGPGRPRGSSNRPKINVSGVETLLLGIHQALHMMSGIAELDMNKDEAAQLAKAYDDAAQFYPILNLDPKLAATLNLASVVSIVYGSKFLAYRLRRTLSAPAKPAPQPVQQPQAPGPVLTPADVNGASFNPPKPPLITPEMRVGEIPGVGLVTFPEGHELGGKRH
jgi:hypothetical protein